MALPLEGLLRDVHAFLEKLDVKDLPSGLRGEHEALLARLRLLGTSGERPSYLDMNGARKLRNTVSCMDGFNSFKESSTDCSVCQDSSADEWPPMKLQCSRPDLSPDWALSAQAASERAVLSGPVFRSGPCRWLPSLSLSLSLPRPLRLPLRRRGWAALLAQPSCRLLVFANARASRPRLVLQLGADPPCGPPCGAECCALYSARTLPLLGHSGGHALELCCPGRKTHQIWMTEEAEAARWLEAIRRTSQPQTDSPDSPPLTSTTFTSQDRTPSPAIVSPPELPQKTDPVLSSESRSASESRASAVSETMHSVAEEHACPPDTQEQQQYESMLSGNEEIYHDIAPPSSENSNYVNVASSSPSPFEEKEVTNDDTDSINSPSRPLYDDVIVPPKTPEYCNLAPESMHTYHASDEEKVGNEHLYDDIGSIGPQTSVYERIQDPITNHGICCS